MHCGSKWADSVGLLATFPGPLTSRPPEFPAGSGGVPCVAVEGWAETSELTAVDLARRFEDAGVSAIIYTDIDRDGVLKGLNIPSTLELARAVSIPVIASGGLASIDDIHRLLEPDCAILEGAISGRALYDGRLDPAEAMRLIRAAREVRA